MTPELGEGACYNDAQGVSPALEDTTALRSSIMCDVQCHSVPHGIFLAKPRVWEATSAYRRTIDREGALVMLSHRTNCVFPGPRQCCSCS